MSAVETVDDKTPVHQWTHDGDRVLLLKVVGADRSAHGGFVWPESGPVVPAGSYSREATCESGGLFGWPWGIGRDGQVPIYRDTLWIVFAAHPDDVIAVGPGKAKAVPNPDLGRTPEVIFCGSYFEAQARILPGQLGWIAHASSGASSATGDSGASSATGYSGASSATGDSGASSATGDRGIAVTTGPWSVVEASATGIAASTAEVVTWKVIEGALLLLRWKGGHRLITAEEIDAHTGDRVRFEKGVVVDHKRATS